MTREGDVTSRVWARGEAWSGLILAIFAARYAPLRGFEFVWDDVDALRDNPLFSGGFLGRGRRVAARPPRRNVR